MYNKFKNCLLKPSLISQYVDEKIGKVVLYFLFLALIYTLPNIVSITSFHKIERNTLNQIVDGFKQSEDIDYQLIKVDEKIKLIPKKVDTKGQYVVIDNFASSYPLVLLFCYTKDNLVNLELPSKLVGKPAIYMSFYEEGLEIQIAKYQGIESKIPVDVQQLTNNEILDRSIIKTTYDKLGVSEFDFTITRGNTNLFGNKVNDFLMTIYNKHKVAILATLIPSTYIRGIIQFLFDALILSILIKILYSQYNIRFGKIYQLVILTYTPRVIFNILSIFWNNIFMFILGEIISVIYLLIAMRFYAMNQIIKNIKE